MLDPLHLQVLPLLELLLVLQPLPQLMEVIQFSSRARLHTTSRGRQGSKPIEHHAGPGLTSLPVLVTRSHQTGLVSIGAPETDGQNSHPHKREGHVLETTTTGG